MSRQLVRFLACSALTLSTASAQAQMFHAMEDEAPSSYRAVGLSIPVINATQEAIARIDFNLAGQGSMGFEGTFKGKREEISEKSQEETGESLMAEGYGVSMVFSRYSSGIDMSGFFWTLGAGYREEKVDWKVAPEETDPEANFSLVNDKNQFEHKAVAKGTTGSLRIGYRYVGSSFPIIAGLYLGARHFQASVKDAEPKSSETNNGSTADAVPMTDRERERLRRRITTSPDAGVEIGFAF